MKYKRWVSTLLPALATYAVPAALSVLLVVSFINIRLVHKAELHAAALTLAFAMFPDAGVPPGADVVVFGIADGHRMGIRMTLQNSTALLSMPLVLATVAIAWLRRGCTRVALLALAATVGVLFVENQVRFLMAAIISNGASASYSISVGAIVFGSTATVVCMASAVLAYVAVFVTKSPANRAAGSGAA